MNAVLQPMPGPPDKPVELLKLKRKLTVKQRRVLAVLGEHHGQFWTALKVLGYSANAGHRWMRNPDFVRARELTEELDLDRIGITSSYVLGRTKEVVERSMQAVPVLDKTGNPLMIAVESEDGVKELAAAYTFNSKAALGGLGLLGKYRRLWSDEAVQPSAHDGPGMTVVVHQGDSRVAVQASPGAQGRVVVSLPEPE